MSKSSVSDHPVSTCRVRRSMWEGRPGQKRARVEDGSFTPVALGVKRKKGKMDRKVKATSAEEKQRRDQRSRRFGLGDEAVSMDSDVRSNSP